MSASAAAPTRQDRLARTSREALSAMGVQFLLGMGANLLEHGVVASIAIGLHVLVGIGLIVVGVRVLLAARAQDVGGRAALWALVITVATFLIGIGTVLAGSEWLSFLMAVGWLAGAALYVATYVTGLRAVPGARATEPTA